MVARKCFYNFWNRKLRLLHFNKLIIGDSQNKLMIARNCHGTSKTLHPHPGTGQNRHTRGRRLNEDSAPSFSLKLPPVHLFQSIKSKLELRLILSRLKLLLKTNLINVTTIRLIVTFKILSFVCIILFLI
jgi:hypothetical protein